MAKPNLPEDISSIDVVVDVKETPSYRSRSVGAKSMSPRKQTKRSDNDQAVGPRTKTLYLILVALIFFISLAILIVSWITANSLKSNPAYSSTPIMITAASHYQIVALLSGFIVLTTVVMFLFQIIPKH